MRRSRNATASLGLLAATAVAACGSTPGGGSTPSTTDAVDGVLAADVRREPPNRAPVEQAVDGLEQFSAELYAEAADPATNLVLSPASIALAFGMARAGAKGETAAQIDEVLHFPPDVHAAFNALEQAVVTSEDPPPRPTATRDASQDQGSHPEPPVVSIANGLFAQDGLTVEQSFLDVLAGQYGAGLRVVDFAQPAQAKAAIDAWVVQQTAGKIEELFPELPESTALVLANAIYLKADWRVPFSDPRDQRFLRGDGSAVQVPMMSADEGLRYAEGDGWQAVEVPYVGNELVMWVLVPAEGSSPTALLAPGVLADVEEGLRTGRVELVMPTWDVAASLDLVPLLSALGLEQPFGPSADFSGITPAGVSIDHAVHKATITVDEWGTEAAAVTGLGFGVSAPPAPEVVVRADHPFAFVVRHAPTGAPLFLGHVADPSAR